ncbi:MAG: hypothetical protein M3270_11540 [Thermoproteota archaeon]|nr:hypothetical protein [Thermoproteota archaeon]
MTRYKNSNFRSRYGVPATGVMGILTLLASVGSYTPSFEANAQYQSQQSSTTIIASSNQNMTGAGSSFNGTISSMPNGTTPITTAANTPNVTLTEFASNIEQIRGHLDQALINKESGNNTLAEAHVLHPIEEIYSNIEEDLMNQNSTLNETLSISLQNLSSTVTTATLEEVRDQIKTISGLLNQSLQAVVSGSEVSSNPAFNASVVAQLLHTAGHEYEEAVANGIIRAIVEYQDAQAFIHRAESIFKSTTSRINQSMAQNVEEVNEGFSNLNIALNNKSEPEIVETTIGGVTHELEEITRIPESQLIGEEEEGSSAEGQSPIAIINNIKSMLNDLIEKYRAQDYQGAESIAIAAYLENYEYIEAPLAQRDQQLMEQTEVLLREDLRQMITDRVPIEQIEQHIDMINGNLDRATQLLQQ